MLGEFWFAGATRRYWALSAGLMLLYAGAIHVAVKVAPMLASPALRVSGVLLPVLPLGGFVYLEYLRIRATDELRQRMELEACMLALAAGVPVLMALGLLDNAGLVRIGLLSATPLLVAAYAAAQLWAYWRYR
jgi:hypothetical protein